MILEIMKDMFFGKKCRDSIHVHGCKIFARKSIDMLSNSSYLRKVIFDTISKLENRDIRPEDDTYIFKLPYFEEVDKEKVLKRSGDSVIILQIPESGKIYCVSISKENDGIAIFKLEPPGDV